MLNEIRTLSNDELLDCISACEDELNRRKGHRIQKAFNEFLAAFRELKELGVAVIYTANDDELAFFGDEGEMNADVTLGNEEMFGIY